MPFAKPRAKPRCTKSSASFVHFLEWLPPHPLCCTRLAVLFFHPQRAVPLFFGNSHGLDGLLLLLVHLHDRNPLDLNAVGQYNQIYFKCSWMHVIIHEITHEIMHELMHEIMHGIMHGTMMPEIMHEVMQYDSRNFEGWGNIWQWVWDHQPIV